MPVSHPPNTRHFQVNKSQVMDFKEFSSSIRLVEVLDLDSVLFYSNVWRWITRKRVNLSLLFILLLKLLPVLLNHTTRSLLPMPPLKTQIARYTLPWVCFVNSSLWSTMRLSTIFARE